MTSCCAPCEVFGRSRLGDVADPVGELGGGAPWRWPWEVPGNPFEDWPQRSESFHPGMASTAEKNEHPAPEGYQWVQADINRGTWREWTLNTTSVARNLERSKREAAASNTFGAAVREAAGDVAEGFGNVVGGAAGAGLKGLFGSVPRTALLVGGGVLVLLLLSRR